MASVQEMLLEERLILLYVNKSEDNRNGSFERWRYDYVGEMMNHRPHTHARMHVHTHTHTHTHTHAHTHTSLSLSLSPTLFHTLSTCYSLNHNKETAVSQHAKAKVTQGQAKVTSQLPA